VWAERELLNVMNQQDPEAFQPRQDAGDVLRDLLGLVRSIVEH
jgi:hypothetical protein